MYEIRLNNELIHEPDADSPRRLAAGTLTEELGCIPSFSFTIPPMNPLFSRELHDRTDIITVTNTLTGEVEFEGVLLTHSDVMDSSGRLCRKAVAEGYLGFLRDSVQLYRNYPEASPAEFLTALLEAHNAQTAPEKRVILGSVDVTRSDYRRSKTTAYRSTLEEIQLNLIDRIGGEIQVRRVGSDLVLDYVEKLGVRCSTAVALADNMRSISSETDSSGIITRLIPLGCQLAPGETAERLNIASVNGGATYIDDAAAVEKYGIIAGTAVFDDITLPENLLKAGREFLAENNRVRLCYEAQALDLSLLEKSRQSLRCGNTYPFRNELLGLDEELRLIGRTVDIYKPWSPTLKIGERSERMTDIAARTAQLIEYELPQQKLDILASARSTATALIRAGTNGYVVVNENEICIMDTPDKATAAKVWRWNSGGFGYSSTGYGGEYGTAMTMDGAIVADFITAGVLRGMEILNGGGTFHVHTDGTVEASAINITGGSVNIQTDSANLSVIDLRYAGERAYQNSISAYGIVLTDNTNNAVQSAVRFAPTGISFHGGGGGLTAAISSVNGDISTNGNITANGDVSGSELRFQRNGGIVSVREEFDSVWAEFQTVWNAINHYHGGGSS